MKRLATLLLVAAALLAVPAMAQDIGYSNSWPLTLPHDTFFGMAAGVATDSKGHVFVYTRNGDPTVTLAGSRPFAHGGSSLQTPRSDLFVQSECKRKMHGISVHLFAKSRQFVHE